MLHIENYMDIKSLHQQGLSIRAISRQSGWSRQTVRAALLDKVPKPFQKPSKTSKLDPYKDHVRQRYEQCALSAVRLQEEIRPMGYQGSRITLQRFIRSLQPAWKLRSQLTVRFETPAGHQAQADWASCGKFTDPQGWEIPVHFFVMVLSYSRMLFIHFTSSMKLEELIVCHQRAFEFFGGWTQQILYDNMKQVRLSQNQWNPLFLDFTQHHGFIPKTHQPYRPRTKGKVERMVDYVKDNFLNGRRFEGLPDLNAQAMHWLTHTANVRLHATTGQRPVDLLAQEQQQLVAFNSLAPYRLSCCVARQVSREGYVSFERSRYSVPPQQVGKTVTVEQHDQKIIVRAAQMIVAEHPKATKPGQCVVAKEHAEALWKLSLLRPMPPSPKWEMTFRQIVQATPLEVYQQIPL